MSKIYVIRREAILEVELIKQTAEQVRVDNSTTKVVWRDSPNAYVPYIPNRMQRYRETYFHTLPEAVAHMKQETAKNIERSIRDMHTYQLQLANLVAFAETLKEGGKTDGN